MSDFNSERNIYSPAYFDGFSCLAGSCPDSCCRAGWEIPIDDETVGILKSRKSDISENVKTGSDGDVIIKNLENGICPYLNAEGLCDMYVKFGTMGDVCQKHPRFYEEYMDISGGSFTEAGLSVSCPEAARVVLQSSLTDYSELLTDYPDDELLGFLLKARKAAFEMVFLSDSADSASDRISMFGELLQEAIDFGEIQDDGIEYAKEEGKLCTFSDDDEFSRLCGLILSDTEILIPEWRKTLERARGGERSAEVISEREKRAALGYWVYRYFLKAVSTEDILGQCRLISALYKLSTELPCGFPESFRMVSKELEHDAENIAALLDYFSERQA